MALKVFLVLLLSVLCNALFFPDDLQEIIASGDIEKTEELLMRYNIDLTASEPDDPFIPLHAAANLGHLALVKHFIALGAPINFQDKHGNTALRHAEANHRDIVDYLIQNQHDVHYKFVNDTTLLHFAVHAGVFESVKYLVDRGVDVNSFDISGFTPFHQSIFLKQEEIAHYLLNNGADIELAGKDGLTPLQQAAFAGFNSIAEALLNRGASILPKPDSETVPALHFASHSNSLRIVAMLLDRYPSAHVPSINNTTPLLYATHRNHYVLSEYLLIRGALPDFESSHKLSPRSIAKQWAEHDKKDLENLFNMYDANPPSKLHSAIIHRDIGSIKTLLESDTDLLKAKEFTGKTPLHYSAMVGDTEILDFLIEKGANINDVDVGGNTALMMAIVGHHELAAMKLIQAKTDLNIQNNLGDTALNFAAIQANLILLNELIDRGADALVKNSLNYTLLHTLVLSPYAVGNMEAFDLLLQQNIDIHAVEHMGGTVLHAATIMNQKEYVKKIISIGIDVNLPDYSTHTPLHYAAANGNAKITSLLLSNNAYIFAVDSKKNTALHIAAHSGSLPVIRILLEFGAIIDAKNEDGNKAIDLAEDNSVIVFLKYHSSNSKPNYPSRIEL